MVPLGHCWRRRDMRGAPVRKWTLGKRDSEFPAAQSADLTSCPRSTS